MTKNVFIQSTLQIHLCRTDIPFGCQRSLDKDSNQCIMTQNLSENISNTVETGASQLVLPPLTEMITAI